MLCLIVTRSICMYSVEILDMFSNNPNRFRCRMQSSNSSVIVPSNTSRMDGYMGKPSAIGRIK